MPKLTNSPLNQVIPTRLNQLDYEYLMNNAKQQNLTLTALLRKLALEYLHKSRQKETTILLK